MALPRRFALIGQGLQGNLANGFSLTGNLTIQNDQAVLTLKDNATSGIASIAFMEWREADNTRLGFVGVGSTGADDVFLTADSGSIQLRQGTTNMITLSSAGNGVTVNVTDTGTRSLRIDNATEQCAIWIDTDGTLTFGDGTGFQGLRIRDTGDLSLSSTDHGLTIGLDSGVNLAFDNNEIQVRNNGAAGTLNIQAEGGSIQIGANTVANVQFRTGTSARWLDSANDDNLGMQHNGTYLDFFVVAGSNSDGMRFRDGLALFMLDPDDNTSIQMGPVDDSDHTLDFDIMAHSTIGSGARLTCHHFASVADDATETFTVATQTSMVFVVNTFNAETAAVIAFAAQQAPVTIGAGANISVGTGSNPDVDGDLNIWKSNNTTISFRNRLGSAREFTFFVMST